MAFENILNSPREKYMTEARFKALVDAMVAQIGECHFTPEELRQATMLASIMYSEMHCIPKFQQIDGGDYYIEHISSEIVRLTPLGEMNDGSKSEPKESG